MNRIEKCKLMMERFVHPSSGYSVQVHYATDNGSRKAGTYFFRQFDGYCRHEPQHTRPTDCSDKTPSLFTSKQMFEHLSGTKTYAPYQIDADGNVKWLCIDVDTYEDVPEEDVRALVMTIAKNIHRTVGPNRCLVEQSGSKGYHLWLFFDELLESHHAYSLGHTLIENVTVPENIVIEVYPKQQYEARVGSTVKLPLGVHQKTGNRCLFVNSAFEPYEDQWERLQSVTATSAAWVRANILAVKPPQEAITSHEMSYTPLCLAEAMDVGVREGLRDEAAFKIACYMRDKGVPKRYAQLVLMAWNNDNNPPMDDRQLDTKLAQGYGPKAYSWKPCALQSFDELCKSSCRFWNRKVERRWSKNNTGNPIGQISRE